MEHKHIEVLERLALMGPNLYAHQPCIKWKVDIGELEERPSNTIPGFVDGLKQMIPSLIEHRCSEGKRGGFFSRLEDGTWMGHIMEHVALELQNLAGSRVGFGRARSAGGKGLYNVVYECEERETGIEAGEMALQIIDDLIEGAEFPFSERLAEFRRLHTRRTLGPSTKSIVDAARHRGIPAIRLDQYNLVQLGHAAFSRRIQATTTSNTKYHGVEIAGNKDLTKLLLGSRGIPVPKGDLCQTEDGALEIAESLGYPVVVKPLDASHGRGIVTDIRDKEHLRKAFAEAKQFRNQIIVEQFIPGHDYRLLIINYKLVAAAQRVPAHVVGDGKHNIRELVELENQNPLRGDGHENLLTKIIIDEMTEHLLGLRDLSLDSVPEPGTTVYLKTTANLSTGGTAIDVTDELHPSNLELAERIARLVDLDIAGIDIVAPSITEPLEETGGAIVEVNAAPGFRMHLAPTVGKPRPVGEAVVDMLFPPGRPTRIPIITVTGTNGKTTTARLCAHIARQGDHHVGLTTTDGIYIQSRRIMKGDCTGPQSAAIVLEDPSVDFAVLETARGGLLRSGLGYDWANVAIVTNIAEDHMGLRDINTLQDLARVKAVTVERVFEEGYAVLNAEDSMTPLIRRHADCHIALFSLNPEHPEFRSHIASGGLGVCLEGEEIVLHDRKVRVAIANVRQIPLTFEGRARFNVANTMAAIAGCYGAKVSLDDIRSGINTFFPSFSQTPGRTNFFEFEGFTVVVDYAHNPHGLAAMGDFVRALKKKHAVGIVAIPGDRRDEDIRKLGEVAASIFDAVILREDYLTRGRPRGEVAAMLKSAMVNVGYDARNIHVCHEELRAIDVAMDLVQEGDLIFYFADKLDEAIQYLEERRKRDGS